MPRITASPAIRPMPWDRAPVTVVTAALERVVEATGQTTRFTYTVPSDTKAFIIGIALSLLVEIVAASVTSTDQVSNLIQITPSGGTVTTLYTLNLSSPAMAAGDRVDQVLAPSGVLVAGDAVVAADFFEGVGAGAGRVLTAQGLAVQEFTA